MVHPCDLIWKNVKTLDSSESTDGYGNQVGRNSQVHVIVSEYINTILHKGKNHCLRLFMFTRFYVPAIKWRKDISQCVCLCVCVPEPCPAYNFVLHGRI